MKEFVIKGDIIYLENKNEIKAYKNHYLVVKDGYCQGVFPHILEEYKDYVELDYSNKLVIPGFFDLHVHASQYQYRGTSMDLELIDWLDKHAFIEEAKYESIEYAEKSYSMFVDELKNGFTTRAAIFATIHKDATMKLMDLLEKSGIVSYVGLVLMNRNSPDYLRLKDDKDTLKMMEEYILESKKYQNTFPIITPRFTPSCTKELMKGLGELRKKYNVTVQSHIDENPSELIWVKELEPECKNYTETYARFGLYGGDHHCIMAHCIYNNDEEIETLKNNKIFVAHCPESNMNVTSGIAPIYKYLDNGINVGLGSDVAGGSSLSLIRAARQAIQISKMYYRYVDQNARQLNVMDAFYMLTLGGGEFFGKVGSFNKGYEFDALVIDDSKIPSLLDFSLLERLERFIYLGDESMLVSKFVKGEKII